VRCPLGRRRRVGSARPLPLTAALATPLPQEFLIFLELRILSHNPHRHLFVPSPTRAQLRHRIYHSSGLGPWGGTNGGVRLCLYVLKLSISKTLKITSLYFEAIFVPRTSTPPFFYFVAYLICCVETTPPCLWCAENDVLSLKTPDIAEACASTSLQNQRFSCRVCSCFRPDAFNLLQLKAILKGERWAGFK